MSRLKRVLIFIGHLFVSTWGVGISSAIVTFYSFAILRPLDPHLFSSHTASWLLTDAHYFPVQVILSFWFGWSFWRRFHHRSMFWVWIPTFFILCCALLAGRLLILEPGSVIEQAGARRFSHYFGSGCSTKDFCEDQLAITMPFYASVGYALSAFLAHWASLRPISLRREAASESPPRL